MTQSNSDPTPVTAVTKQLSKDELYALIVDMCSDNGDGSNAKNVAMLIRHYHDKTVTRKMVTAALLALIKEGKLVRDRTGGIIGTHSFPNTTARIKSGGTIMGP